MAPRVLVGLNAAMLPFEGLAGQVFAPVARLLAGIPAVPSLFAWRAADRGVVERLLRDTGSTLDARGIELYARVVRQPGHVAAALGMMAHWELRPLLRDLKALAVPLVLVVGGHDRTVPPSDARRIRAAVPGVRIIDLPALGHLAHEERPAEVAGLIARVAAQAGVATSEAA
jgi:magnesium chelatase accessory protein